MLIEPTKKDLMYLGAPQFIDRRTEPARVLDDRCCALSCQLSIILPFGGFFFDPLTPVDIRTYDNADVLADSELFRDMANFSQSLRMIMKKVLVVLSR